MLTRARNAVRTLARRRRAPRTLLDLASHLELAAGALADRSVQLSPARLAAAAGDLAIACDHLVDATDAWGEWLGAPASSVFAVGDVDVDVVDARERLRVLRDRLRESSASATALSASLAEIARHDDRRPGTS